MADRYFRRHFSSHKMSLKRRSGSATRPIALESQRSGEPQLRWETIVKGAGAMGDDDDQYLAKEAGRCVPLGPFGGSPQ